MNAESFIASLKEVLVDDSLALDALHGAAVGDNDPLERYREWYRALGSGEREIVSGLIQYTERLTIFHVLNVIDGVLPIFEDQDGEFKLSYVENTASDDLTADHEPSLHDIFRSMVDL